MPEANTPVVELRNLGPVSAKQLAKINILTYADLKAKSAIATYAELLKLSDNKPSLNFLYAILGALEDKSWTEFKCQKGELLIQLESYLEIDKHFK